MVGAVFFVGSGQVSIHKFWVGRLPVGLEHYLRFDKWERWERDISREIARVDYALLDGAFFANGEIPGRDMSQIPHPFIEESLDRFGALPPAERPKIHFIHFNHTNPVLQAGGNARSTIRSAGMRVARQGMIWNYSASSKFVVKPLPNCYFC